MQQVNITLGTAGHIDHGKTALVKSLTGCETDRLKEEKERGMSIDLGFAPCRIADKQVGIVDVPGHENFIKTMVAGANGMDAVILVVAADDGIMPQTREHLDILTLLGLRHGIVALTKIDRVDAEHRHSVEASLAGFLRGTFLEGAPILPVSNVTGEGFDAFLEALWSLVESIKPRRVDGVFRLPLDRAFSVQGYGTVVAGIPISGAAHVGDEVVLLPQKIAGRIRRIEVYGQPSDTLMAGQCAAINVGHWDHHTIRRGDTLTLPGFFAPEQWFICKLRLLQRDKLLLKSGAEVKFHAGTTEVAAMFYPLKGHTMDAGAEDFVQIKTKAPVVAGPGDHFLLRTPSPVRTIGGGLIVEAVPQRIKGSRPGVYEDICDRAQAVLDERRYVEYCVRHAEATAITEAALSQRTKILPARLQKLLADWGPSQFSGTVPIFVSAKMGLSPSVLQFSPQRKWDCPPPSSQETILALAPKLYIHRDTLAELEEKAVTLVRDFHRQSPESPGMPLDELRQAMLIDKAVLDALLACTKTAGRLIEKNGRLAVPEHRSTFVDEDEKLLATIEGFFREKPFSPPSPEDIAQQTKTQPSKLTKLLNLLREHDRLVQVEPGLFFHREAIDRARELLQAHFRKEGRLESVQFKYLLDTTRKYAIPLLDYLDRSGLTRRVGNTRYPKGPATGRTQC